jgi:2'-5' RNA ligase
VIATEPTERLFFALWPSAETRAALVQAVKPLRESANGRAIPPENYHLTLAFLDSVPVATISEVITVARNVSFLPFELTLDCYGIFEQPKVLWYGCSAVPDPVRGLVANLRSSLNGLVKLRPERSFCPHVSVVRKMSALPQLAPPAKLVWQASDFALVRSDYGPGHAIYTVLQRFSAASA